MRPAHCVSGRLGMEQERFYCMEGATFSLLPLPISLSAPSTPLLFSLFSFPSFFLAFCLLSHIDTYTHLYYTPSVSTPPSSGLSRLAVSVHLPASNSRTLSPRASDQQWRRVGPRCTPRTAHLGPRPSLNAYTCEGPRIRTRVRARKSKQRYRRVCM